MLNVRKNEFCVCFKSLYSWGMWLKQSITGSESWRPLFLLLHFFGFFLVSTGHHLHLVRVYFNTWKRLFRDHDDNSRCLHLWISPVFLWTPSTFSVSISSWDISSASTSTSLMVSWNMFEWLFNLIRSRLFRNSEFPNSRTYNGCYFCIELYLLHRDRSRDLQILLRQEDRLREILG